MTASLGVQLNRLSSAPQAWKTIDVQRSIEAALERHAHREASRVEVEVKDGRATVSGIVESQPEHDAIVGAAKGTPGVRSVEDKLRLVPSAS